LQYNNEIRTPNDVSALPQKVKQVNYVPRKDMTLCRFSFPGPIQGRSFLRKQAISLDFVEEISKMTNTLLQDLTPISLQDLTPISRDPDFPWSGHKKQGRFRSRGNRLLGIGSSRFTYEKPPYFHLPKDSMAAEVIWMTSIG